MLSTPWFLISLPNYYKLIILSIILLSIHISFYLSFYPSIFLIYLIFYPGILNPGESLMWASLEMKPVSKRSSSSSFSTFSSSSSSSLDSKHLHLSIHLQTEPITRPIVTHMYVLRCVSIVPWNTCLLFFV